jgi:uncharacterized protein YcbX
VEVVELWRYPVKSLLGEQLERVEIGHGCVIGDREYAVIDVASGGSLSAKRQGELLGCRAWTEPDRVMVELPDGAQHLVTSAAAADALSELLGRSVEVRRAGRGQDVRHEFPTDFTTGEGEPQLIETGMTSFFDMSPLMLITTATLRALSALVPDSDFAVARFRPNFVVETDAEGFVEQNWVGGDVEVGSVRCHVVDHCIRCVMTTRPQGDLPRDKAILQAVAKHNDSRAGIRLRAESAGTVSIGDEVTA